MCACMHYERGVLGEYIHRTIKCSEINVANMPYKMSQHGKANTCISAGSNSEIYPVHGSASEENRSGADTPSCHGYPVFHPFVSS